MKTENQQTVVIAGATGNIGKAAAIELAKRGARVVLLGRNHDKLQATKHSICDKLSKVCIDFQEQDVDTLETDFSEMQSVRLAAKEAMDRYPEINALVLSERLRKTIGQKSIKIKETPFKITISGGVAGFPADARLCGSNRLSERGRCPAVLAAGRGAGEYPGDR